MKASLARALEIANKIDGGHIVGIPEDDPIKLFHSIHGLRHLAVQFREALGALAVRPLCKAAERLVIDIKDNDYDGAVVLHAGLVGIGHRLQDLVDDQGDDPEVWQFPDPAKGSVAESTNAPNEKGWQKVPNPIENQTDTAMSGRPSPELHPLERKSMLKIIRAIAIKTGHKPGAKRTPATALITSAVAEMGLIIDEGTVLKYLREADDAFSNDALSS